MQIVSSDQSLFLGKKNKKNISRCHLLKFLPRLLSLKMTSLVYSTLGLSCCCMFQVPVSKFHELRYNVAFVLKEMEDLEKRSILKIQD